MKALQIVVLTCAAVVGGAVVFRLVRPAPVAEPPAVQAQIPAEPPVSPPVTPAPPLAVEDRPSALAAPAELPKQRRLKIRPTTPETPPVNAPARPSTPAEPAAPP